MPLVPPSKPQVITSTKAAVLEHTRETAPDKIQVIVSVSDDDISLAVALLRRTLASKKNSYSLVLIPDSV